MTHLHLKRINTTRLSARYEAVVALTTHYKTICENLQTYADEFDNGEIAFDAENILNSMNTYRFYFYLQVWDYILKNVNNTTINLKKITILMSEEEIFMGFSSSEFQELMLGK